MSSAMLRVAPCMTSKYHRCVGARPNFSMIATMMVVGNGSVAGLSGVCGACE